jgi:hypothetical protein
MSGFRLGWLDRSDRVFDQQLLLHPEVKHAPQDALPLPPRPIGVFGPLTGRVPLIELLRRDLIEELDTMSIHPPHQVYIPRIRSFSGDLSRSLTQFYFGLTHWQEFHRDPPVISALP